MSSFTILGCLELGEKFSVGGGGGGGWSKLTLVLVLVLGNINTSTTMHQFSRCLFS